MAKKPIMNQESFSDLHFPLVGIDLSTGFDRQPTRPVADSQYSKSTPFGENVRSYEPVTKRARGGQRPGLVRYINFQPSGKNLIQQLAGITGVGYTPPGGGVQSSQSGRVVTLVAVSNGNVMVADAGASNWTATINGTAALNTTGIVFSATNIQKLWFADGIHYVFYQPSDNTVHPWIATAGTLPVDSDGNAPRLITTWRGRTVLSGLLKDPQNWFMSAVGDPTDYDYSPLSTTPTQAVAGNNSTLGLVGDVITSLIPFNDDVLIFGGDHTLWVCRGDPMAGGQIDRISDSIGVAWGEPWCKDPYGNVYFVSNRTGIYTLVPGQAPQRMSQQIEQLLADVNTGVNTIRLIWDDRFQGLHVFISRTAGPGPSQHFFWEQRVGAWWTDSFGNNDHNPLCCCTFDGNTPTDRVALIGSWDGYIRYLSADATKDDGTVIESSVILGPILSKDLDEILLKDLQAVLGMTSADVDYAVYVGRTAEEALASDPVATGTWTASRNFNSHIRRSGHAIYVKITATAPWAMETIRARIAGLGKVRRRA